MYCCFWISFVALLHVICATFQKINKTTCNLLMGGAWLWSTHLFLFCRFSPGSKWTVKIDVTACKRLGGPCSQKSSKVTQLPGELTAKQHFTRFNALSWKDNKEKIRWMEVPHLYDYFHRCLPFPKCTPTELTFPFNRTKLLWADYGLPFLPRAGSTGCSHRSISEGRIWPWHSMFYLQLFSASGRAIHQS